MSIDLQVNSGFNKFDDFFVELKIEAVVVAAKTIMRQFVFKYFFSNMRCQFTKSLDNVALFH